MKPDDFEKRLQSQPLRRIPSEWRAEILKNAESSRPSILDPRTSFLSALLWPNPKAWIGLAAVWVLSFAIQFESRNGARVVIGTSKTTRTEMLAALKDQRVILVELINSTEPRDVDKSRHLSNRPHSESRRPFSIA